MVRVKQVQNKGFGGPNISFEEGKYTVIDNFLDYEQFKGLQEAIVFNDKFPFSAVKTVSSKRKKIKDIEDKRLWSWYMLHMVYENDMPVSEFAQPLMELFSPRFVDLGVIKSLARVKINMFPYDLQTKCSVEIFFQKKNILCEQNVSKIHVFYLCFICNKLSMK